MSSVTGKTHDMQLGSDDGRLPSRLSCSQTRLPDSLAGLGSVQSGTCVLSAPQQADRFEFPCTDRPTDCINGGVTDKGNLVVEVYYGPGEDRDKDFSGHDIELSRADAIALAAWINEAYGVTP